MHTRPSDSEAIEVEGITVAPPLTGTQAHTLASYGLLADSTDSLIGAWLRVESMWAETVEVARSDPGEIRLLEKVKGEWSFVETLRHLIFVTDAWVGVGVLGSKVRHSLGLPPHFVTNGAELGLDLEARPDLDTVLPRGLIVRRPSRARFAPYEATLANRASDPCRASLA